MFPVVLDQVCRCYSRDFDKILHTDLVGFSAVAMSYGRKAQSILPSIRCSFSLPLAEKHPQSMMFSPPCFTVGMVFLGLYSSFFLQTRRGEFTPKSSIFV
ncbi:hypothetical protein ATANTOWER_031800 [Ataeniobius toweri]|uniref:Uncharacterized protein n=1 Tax=Ataeniobius toweri TaxID=208326 RepID=A0ABU7CAR0_9TELE|nr:hypothetical protein [Ataeniobius toweri]